MVNPRKLVRKLDLSAVASVLNVGENREAWAPAFIMCGRYARRKGDGQRPGGYIHVPQLCSRIMLTS